MDGRRLLMRGTCRHLGASNDTVYKWIDKNAMPTHRFGRLWKFKTDEVDAWIIEGGAAGRTNTPVAKE